MKTLTERNTSAFIHLSIFSQYFFPLGNYLFPIIIWTTKKDQSQFVDQNGKQALNFQLSILMYTLIFALIAIPIFIYTVLKNFSFTDLMHNNDIVFEKF